MGEELGNKIADKLEEVISDKNKFIRPPEHRKKMESLISEMKGKILAEYYISLNYIIFVEE